MSIASPLLSVCLPVFNPGHYLVTTIESILEQDFHDFELIIVDDCSERSLDEIISQFRDSRIKLIRNELNLGLPANWNRCIELACGELVTIFHQDDLMLAGNLALKVAMLNRHPSVGLVYSDMMRIDESGKSIGGHYLPQPSEDFVAPGVELFRMTAETGNPIACPTVMVRAESFRRVGKFDAALPLTTDHHMWMRIALAYDIAYVARSLVAYRVHDTQESHRFLGTGRDYQEVLKSFDKLFSTPLPPQYANYTAATYRTLAAQALPMGRWKLRQGKILPALRYTAVYIKARIRSRRRAFSPT
jgi:glycosyltransferase involved in cell wall biosynthesis